ncbi:MAG TPA: hypothetical protein DEB37_16345 [Lysinibacillus sp.]|jgi:hypothetical protein|uniref:Uncharacterized protein n=1 Tax=Lysinibacillus fusiformis TaxID=28031 RepID=A0A2I0UXI2_9BACI|nr:MULTISPECIES: hypothetical protein [Lysinibacillus]HBT73749.1 hypothetical protein [Lysinibacillus sp.]KUF29014.1 hypothetical protein AK833_20310 [Lysinibacillus sp. F5]PKU50773.1 hypothetical protein CRI88_16455 [Lysinibacillus fusiformis]WCH47731.1 hypothetical protein NV349_22565 [Lysinibacillus sp. OF-1]SCY69949.1 hypothetical protein SAMN02787078_02184 [Lysinibacillus sp. SG9]
MISIQSTEQLTGVRVSGDYWDLDELINAIYKVTGDENKYYDYQGPRLRILSVCYKLRHAMLGEHHLDFVSNGLNKNVLTQHELIFPNKNVYFATEILWPEIIFSAIALNDFIDLHQQLNNASMWNYEIAILRKFQAAIADCLEQEIDEEDYVMFVRMLHAKNPFTFRFATQYVDVLNLEYIQLSKEERKAHLAAFAVRLMVEDHEYLALKSTLMEAAITTKQALHDIQIQLNYPEEILW